MNNVNPPNRKKIALTLFVIALVVFGVFAFGLSTGNNNQSGSAAEFIDGGASSSGDYSTGKSVNGSTVDVAPEVSTPGDSASAPDKPVASEQKVITTGDLTAKVKNPAATSDEFIKWVNSNAGVVNNLTERVPDPKECGYATDGSLRSCEQDSYSTVTVRVPDIYKAIDEIKSLNGVEILSKEISKNDVTAQYKDTEAQIHAYEISIDRLEGFLGKATNYNDVFQIEGELTRRQAALDGLNAQLKALKGQVDLNTLTVTFTSTEKYISPTDEAKDGVLDGFKSGWNSLVGFIGGVLFSLAVLTPWLILIIPALLIGLYFFRRVRRNKLSKSTSVDKN